MKFHQGKAGLIKDNKTVDFKVLVPLKYFKVLVPLKYFKVLVGLRSQFKYSTSDFTGITKSSCNKKARLFKKQSDFGIPVKSDVEYLNYYLKNNLCYLCDVTTSNSIQDGGALVVNILVFNLRVQLQHCTYQRKTLLFALIKFSTFICKREIPGLSSPLR